MLVKNILATFAIAGLAMAAPTEDFDADAGAPDVEARDSVCPGTPPDRSWCCKSSVPFNIFFIEGAGNGCKRPTYQGCPYGTYALCCRHKQIASGGNIVCVK
ncbi:hypothetical protein N7462_002638 [Penicillium macrosclerotiorum]|uniref:uncharacterized protein n=1 Tax=Penicillium macrosclerotiorum TaxID=303699 RepID=UPI0025479003|nr:uncharacterized protein N7462_002638 [Penicillium macrosclerotiorum]KAJ5693215.1 hypothetical protein N7462_002638 [Penicillium macrosclerotiorum]